MTRALVGADVAARINQTHPETAIQWNATDVWIEPPSLLREVTPDYTEQARRAGLEGEVLLELVVGPDGGVSNVRVLRPLGAGLDEQAVAAVRQWRFAPARRLGTAVAVIVEVAVEFRLR